MRHSSYLQFIEKSKAVWGDIPHRQQQLLQAVLKHNSPGIQRVTDLIQMSEIGSQATVHAALSQLVKAQLIKLTNLNSDNRSKQVNLTPKALAIFAKLDKLLQSCSGR